MAGFLIEDQHDWAVMHDWESMFDAAGPVYRMREYTCRLCGMTYQCSSWPQLGECQAAVVKSILES
jgi:hypothetical protein